MTTPTPEAFEALVGRSLFDYQRRALQQFNGLSSKRMCLFYRTGAGKSLTALLLLYCNNTPSVLIVAPPVTHKAWAAAAQSVGLTSMTVSHAKFRQKDFKLSRTTPIIVDEFHLLGGHKGVGWKKMDRLAQSLQAPLLILSATPQYNDAERVYCVQHVLDPRSVQGGFLSFLYEHCETVASPFSMMPEVTGFRRFDSATDYLVALPQVAYVEDNVSYSIEDVYVPIHIPDEFETYGLVRRTNRIVASIMEKRHARKYLTLIKDDGQLNRDVYDMLIEMVGARPGPVLLYCDSARVAQALGVSLRQHHVRNVILDGSLTSKQKDQAREDFLSGSYEVLVGTATMATGLDGLDKLCDTLIIVDDTSDAALRRQLIGRIMPRGADVDTSSKAVYRLIF